MKIDERELQRLAERFCAAPLPASVCADMCATKSGQEVRYGTNLLTAEEAREVLRYVLSDPEPAPLVETKPGTHKAEELIFAAYSRCPCGLGLAYVKGEGGQGLWDCSGILMGTADARVKHTDQLPFIFYDVRSELQPSVQGATTRPKS
jgi:hypothetical protein